VIWPWAWLHERRDKRLRSILVVLGVQRGGVSAGALCDLLGRRRGTIHADLARLERLEQISSWWDEGFSPRRRMYGLRSRS
jgi:hypothetical protein